MKKVKSFIKNSYWTICKLFFPLYYLIKDSTDKNRWRESPLCTIIFSFFVFLLGNLNVVWIDLAVLICYVILIIMISLDLFRCFISSDKPELVGYVNKFVLAITVMIIMEIYSSEFVMEDKPVDVLSTLMQFIIIYSILHWIYNYLYYTWTVLFSYSIEIIKHMLAFPALTILYFSLLYHFVANDHILVNIFDCKPLKDLDCWIGKLIFSKAFCYVVYLCLLIWFFEFIKFIIDAVIHSFYTKNKSLEKNEVIKAVTGILLLQLSGFSVFVHIIGNAMKGFQDSCGPLTWLGRMDAVYYTVMTFTSVGFGDITPCTLNYIEVPIFRVMPKLLTCMISLTGFLTGILAVSLLLSSYDTSDSCSSGSKR